MNLVTFFLGVVGGLLANYLSLPFSRGVTKMLSWMFHILDPNRFDLSGTWEHTFEEPDPGNPLSKRKETECLRLNHLGNVVSGTGETKLDKRYFAYELHVTHNLVFMAPTPKKARRGISQEAVWFSLSLPQAGL